MLQIKRIYDAPDTADGYRILIDRLWPRGVSKEHARLDLWLKGIAPSPELRAWFGHDPAKFISFSKQYEQELAHNPAVGELRHIIGKHPTVTLLYGAKDKTANNAVVLQTYLLKSSHEASTS